MKPLTKSLNIIAILILLVTLVASVVFALFVSQSHAFDNTIVIDKSANTITVNSELDLVVATQDSQFNHYLPVAKDSRYITLGDNIKLSGNLVITADCNINLGGKILDLNGYSINISHNYDGESIIFNGALTNSSKTPIAIDIFTPNALWYVYDATIADSISINYDIADIDKTLQQALSHALSSLVGGSAGKYYHSNIPFQYRYAHYGIEYKYSVDNQALVQQDGTLGNGYHNNLARTDITVSITVNLEQHTATASQQITLIGRDNYDDWAVVALDIVQEYLVNTVVASEAGSYIIYNSVTLPSWNQYIPHPTNAGYEYRTVVSLTDTSSSATNDRDIVSIGNYQQLVFDELRTSDTYLYVGAGAGHRIFVIQSFSEEVINEFTETVKRSIFRQQYKVGSEFEYGFSGKLRLSVLRDEGGNIVVTKADGISKVTFTDFVLPTAVGSIELYDIYNQSMGVTAGDRGLQAITYSITSETLSNYSAYYIDDGIDKLVKVNNNASVIAIDGQQGPFDIAELPIKSAYITMTMTIGGVTFDSGIQTVFDWGVISDNEDQSIVSNLFGSYLLQLQEIFYTNSNGAYTYSTFTMPANFVDTQFPILAYNLRETNSAGVALTNGQSGCISTRLVHITTTGKIYYTPRFSSTSLFEGLIDSSGASITSDAVLELLASPNSHWEIVIDIEKIPVDGTYYAVDYQYNFGKSWRQQSLGDSSLLQVIGIMLPDTVIDGNKSDWLANIANYKQLVGTENPLNSVTRANWIYYTVWSKYSSGHNFIVTAELSRYNFNLDISGLAVEASGIPTIGKTEWLKYVSNTKELVLNDIQFPDVGLQYLSGNNNVVRLELAGKRLDPNGAIPTVAANMRKNMRLTNLSTLGALANLATFDVSFCQIQSFAPITLTNYPSLDTLQCHSNIITRTINLIFFKFDYDTNYSTRSSNKQVYLKMVLSKETIKIYCEENILFVASSVGAEEYLTSNFENIIYQSRLYIPLAAKPIQGQSDYNTKLTALLDVYLPMAYSTLSVNPSHYGMPKQVLKYKKLKSSTIFAPTFENVTEEYDYVVEYSNIGLSEDGVSGDVIGGVFAVDVYKRTLITKSQWWLSTGTVSYEEVEYKPTITTDGVTTKNPEALFMPTLEFSVEFVYV